MKVKEYAAEKGVSAQAVYQRIKGIKGKTNNPLSYYIEPKTSELTGEAVNILNQLYDGKQQVKEIPVKTVDDKINELKTTIDFLEKDKINLLDKVETLKNEVARLEKTIEGLNNDKVFLQSSMSHMQTIIEGMSAAQQKPSFFKRLFAGKKEQPAGTDTQPSAKPPEASSK